VSRDQRLEELVSEKHHLGQLSWITQNVAAKINDTRTRYSRCTVAGIQATSSLLVIQSNVLTFQANFVKLMQSEVCRQLSEVSRFLTLSFLMKKFQFLSENVASRGQWI